MQFPCTCRRAYPGVQRRCKCSRRSCRASKFVARDVQLSRQVTDSINKEAQSLVVERHKLVDNKTDDF